MSTRDDSLLALLDALKEFESHNSYPVGFNIFQAVGMEKQEIKHSNFLSFLLNPSESHPFGDALLRNILRDAARKSTVSGFLQIQRELKDYSDAKVHREWSAPSISKRKIDLVVISEQNKEVYVIEVKVDSTESENQLSDYKNIIDNYPRFSVFKKFFIYLVSDACDAEPSDPNWVKLDFGLIANEICNLIDKNSGIDIGLKRVMLDYVQLLRRKVVDDEELKEVCRKIYKEHKKALDLILEYGNIDTGAFGEAATNFFDKQKKLVSVSKVKPRTAAFLPEEYIQQIPEHGLNWHGQSRPILAWFGFFNDRVQLIFEVGPMVDKEFRADLIKRLRSLLGYRETAKIKDEYTRCWTKTKKIENDDEQDQSNKIYDALLLLWGELSAILQRNETELIKIFNSIPEMKNET